MKLSTLPLVVLDTIFRNADIATLLAISQTCKILHYEANRFLYRDPPALCQWLEHKRSEHQSYSNSRFERPTRSWLENRMVLFEKCLVKNPRNARFLHIHISFSVKLLQTIWSQVPLTLTELRLHHAWFRSSNEEIVKCINSRHQDTRVKRLFLDADLEGGFRDVLKLLGSFQFLEVLQVQLWSEASLQLDELISELDCPQLKRLIIKFSDLVISLGEKLPSLEVVQIYRLYDCQADGVTFEESLSYSPDDKWNNLLELMNRNIYFVQTLFPMSYDRDISLLPFVFNYAEKKGIDPIPVVTWLL